MASTSRCLASLEATTSAGANQNRTVEAARAMIRQQPCRFHAKSPHTVRKSDAQFQKSEQAAFCPNSPVFSCTQEHDIQIRPARTKMMTTTTNKILEQALRLNERRQETCTTARMSQPSEASGGSNRGRPCGPQICNSSLSPSISKSIQRQKSTFRHSVVLLALLGCLYPTIVNCQSNLVPYNSENYLTLQGK